MMCEKQMVSPWVTICASNLQCVAPAALEAFQASGVGCVNCDVGSVGASPSVAKMPVAGCSICSCGCSLHCASSQQVRCASAPDQSCLLLEWKRASRRWKLVHLNQFFPSV